MGHIMTPTVWLPPRRPAHEWNTLVVCRVRKPGWTVHWTTVIGSVVRFVTAHWGRRPQGQRVRPASRGVRMRRHGRLLRRPAVHRLTHCRAGVVDVAAEMAKLVLCASGSMEHLLRAGSVSSVHSCGQEGVLMSRRYPGISLRRIVMLRDGLLLTEQRIELLRG